MYGIRERGTFVEAPDALVPEQLAACLDRADSFLRGQLALDLEARLGASAGQSNMATLMTSTGLVTQAAAMQEMPPKA